MASFPATINFSQEASRIALGVLDANAVELGPHLRVFNRAWLKMSMHLPVSEPELPQALVAIRAVIESRKGTFSGFPESKVIQLVLTLLLAGGEMTRELLTFIALELARRPAMQDELHAELLRTNVLECPLLHKIFTEGIRLFCPAYSIPRIARAPLQVRVGGVEVLRVNPFESINVCPAFAGRDPVSFAPDPNVFRPERHAAHAELQWLPFGKSCKGEQIATKTVKLFFAHFVRQFRFHLERPDVRFSFAGDNTLHLVPDVVLLLERR